MSATSVAHPISTGSLVDEARELAFEIDVIRLALHGAAETNDGGEGLLRRAMHVSAQANRLADRIEQLHAEREGAA